MKYLGIDWGLKKVGLAVSEGTFASPLTTLNISSLEDGVNKIVGVVQNQECEMLIIGLPEGKSKQRVEAVIKKLRQKGLEVIEVDETLSTKEAKQVLIEMGVSRKKRQDDNAQSAVIILQRYLDENI